MTATTYFLYLAAVIVLVVTPGPTMLMSISNAALHGTGRALVSTAGSVSAVLGVMLLSSLGLGAILAASELAFTLLKMAGAAYLIYLGVSAIRSNGREVLTAAAPATGQRRRSLFLQGWMVGASNPKALLFFSAFFPQFIDPQGSFAWQFAVLALTFMAIEFSVLSLCCVFAARLGPWLRRPGRTRWFNRISGGLFVAMGALLLLLRRPST